VQRRDHLLRYVLALELAHRAVFFFKKKFKATIDKFTTLYKLQHTEIICFAMFWHSSSLMEPSFFFKKKFKATIDKFTLLCNLQHTEIIRFAMFWQPQLALAAVFFWAPKKKNTHLQPRLRWESAYACICFHTRTRFLSPPRHRSLALSDHTPHARLPASRISKSSPSANSDNKSGK
jgi:hypothetical protein